MLRYRIFDFSENNLKNLHGFDWSSCGGGNEWIAVAYMARWSGPALESDDPYHDWIAPPVFGLPPARHIQDVHMFPGKGSSLDNNNIKQALMMYGGLDVAYFHDDAYYNAANAAYNYQGSVTDPNHQVTLVGWNDNFSGSAFSPAAPGPGAYIVKNSWGVSWGEQGYFYVSYHDKNFAWWGVNSFVDGELSDNYSKVYQYDPYGWVSNWGYNNETAWFANIFQAESDELLSAVSFYSASPNAPYIVDIYTNVGATPTAGTFASRTSGVISTPGYHTVKLVSPVPVAAGEKFAAVVRLTTPGYNYPVATEDRLAGYNSNATAAYGQSFLSSNGTSWTDFQDFNANGNAALKVFTRRTPDLFWRNADNGNFSMWHLGGSKGGNLVSAFTIYSGLPMHFSFIGAADFDGNGWPDYVWYNSTVGNVGIWYMNGTTTIGSTQTLLAGWPSNYRFAGVADFDGDGHPDILAQYQNSSGSYAMVFYMGGPRSTRVESVYSLGYSVDPSQFFLEGAADIDGNGIQDMLWRNLSNGNLGIWRLQPLNPDGRALFTGYMGPLLWGVPWSYKLGGIADFDGDGKKDLVWLDKPAGKVEIWYLGGLETSTVLGMHPVYSGLTSNFSLVGVRAW